MNVIDRFQLEKSLTDKSAEAEAWARKTAEKERKLQEVNQQLQEVNVKNHNFLKATMIEKSISSQSRQSWKQRQRKQPGRKLNYNQ